MTSTPLGIDVTFFAILAVGGALGSLASWLAGPLQMGGLALALLFHAAPAAAADAVRLSIYGLPAAGDVASTLRFRSRGVDEANGLVRSRPVFVLARVAMTVAAIKVDESLEDRPVWRKVLRCAWVGGGLYIFKRNWSAGNSR